MCKFRLNIFVLTLSSFLCVSCYFMTPSPKTYKYLNLNEFSIDVNSKLNLLSTPSNKMFLFHIDNDDKIDSVLLCGFKYKNQDYFKFYLDTVNKKDYILNFKINDYKFYNEIIHDTIRIKYFSNKKVELLKFIYAER